MPRGRKPKSPELRALDGDTRNVGGGKFAAIEGRRPRPEGEVRPRGKLTAAARRVWRSLAPALEHERILRPTDAILFGEFCQVIADLEEAEAIIRRDGMTIEVPLIGKGGEIVGRSIKPHPLSTRCDRLRGRAQSLGAEFGLSASSRSRVMGDERGKRKPESLAEKLKRRAADRAAERAAHREAGA